MRDSFFNTLVKLRQSQDNIFFLTGDMGFSSYEKFQKLFPRNFINMGPAEQNMIGVSSGLAMEGNYVFIYSIIPFITQRVLEHVKLNICHHNLPVCIVGAGAGFSYTSQGYTHHAIDDLPGMVALPNLEVFSPADSDEIPSIMERFIKTKSPTYIRITKNKSPKIDKLHNIESNKFSYIQKGKDFIIFTTSDSWQIAKEVKVKNKSFSIIHIPKLKPFDEKLLLEQVKNAKYVFSIEEHTLALGLGHLIGTALIENCTNMIKFRRFGLQKDISFIEAGSRNYLRSKYGLCPQMISKQIEQILKET